MRLYSSWCKMRASLTLTCSNVKFSSDGQGLLACVIKEGVLNRRLETFANLCGLTLDGHKEGSGTYTEIQCSYYFRALGIIFGQNVHLLEECMNSFVSFIRPVVPCDIVVHPG